MQFFLHGYLTLRNICEWKTDDGKQFIRYINVLNFETVLLQFICRQHSLPNTWAINIFAGTEHFIVLT